MSLQEGSQNVLDQVILGLAHELNNPNAFIRMSLVNLKKMFELLDPCFEAFEKEHPDQKLGRFNVPELVDKIKQQHESILGATQRIISIADKLKEATSSTLHKGTLVNLQEICEGVIEMHRFLLSDKIEIKWLSGSFPPQDTSFIGHHLQLEQALSILLTNAFDAIRIKGDMGHIGFRIIPHEHSVKLEISDNGCGISAHIQEKIFNPFFTTKPQGQGEGLGLAICKSIIQRHKGTIEVKSTEGVGTTFTLVFPKDAV